MTNTLSNNFSGGEVSPRLFGRPEVTKVKHGAKIAENTIIAVHGGAYKRTGTKFVSQLPDQTRHRFIKFQFSTSDTYMLAFGDYRTWFFKNQGIITHTPKNITGITQASTAVVSAPLHGFTDGDWVYVTGVLGMTELNNRHFIVDNATTNTFELTDGVSGIDSSGYTAYSSAGTVGETVELFHTYTSEQVQRIQFTQIRDVMYLVHPEHPMRKLSRASDTSWTLEEIHPTTGPFRTINADEDLTLTPSAFSNAASDWGTYVVDTTLTLTASKNYFNSSMVGAMVRMFEEGGESGIAGAAIGDSTATISQNDVYTYQGNVYGVGTTSGSSNWGPFNRVPEHTSGVTRVKTNNGAAFFDSYFLHPGYCVVQITGYTSATEVTAKVVRYQMPEAVATSGTSFFEEGAWSDYRGWPNSICLFEQRLFLGGNTFEPTTIWGSRSGAYEDFEDGEDDDDAVTYRISAGDGDVIRWLSGRRVLTAGTSAGEFAINASSQQEALTPSNVKAVQQADVGSSDTLPVYIDQAVLYPEREGEPANPSIRLREFAYAFQDDRFNSVDLTIFSEHIFGAGIQKLAYARTPERLIWACRTDGTLACCTYQRDQEAVPWHRHIVGGNGRVVEIAVMPGADGDELWMQVDRTINGVDVSYCEVLTKRFRENITDKEDAVFLDSSLTYNGAVTDSLSGLWHLRGETVKLLINGAVSEATVSLTGKIEDLEVSDETITVGYPYAMKLQVTELEAGHDARQGTAQARMKRISQCHVRVLQSLGGKIGSDENDLELLRYHETGDPMDTSAPLHDGFIEVDFPGGFDRELSLMIVHDDPLPFHVTAIVADQSAGG
jgi:hypothetical protein